MNTKDAGIIANRINQEIDRQNNKEENFWKIVEENTKFSVDVAKVESFNYSASECGFESQCISKPEDIKINFRNE
jgi:hypothetical protein